jgi:O-methyltransferase
MKWLANKLLHWPVDLVESCLPLEKQRGLLGCIEQVKNIEGDIVECGVYRGGGTILIADELRAQHSTKRILAFDSFEGMPDAMDEDAMSNGRKVYVAGVLSTTSLDLVRDKVRRFGHADRVTFYKGYFQDSIPRAIASNDRVSLALIDCDQYAGTKYCLDYLYDKVTPGGMMLLDDYEGPGEVDTPGVKRAVSEFLQGKPERGHMVPLGGTLYGMVKM